MMASLRRALRGVSSLISAFRMATGFAVVSFSGATVASAGLFLVEVFFLPVPVLFFTVRGFGLPFVVVCAWTLPARIRMAMANAHNLIRYFFIALFLFKRVRRKRRTSL